MKYSKRENIEEYIKELEELRNNEKKFKGHNACIIMLLILGIISGPLMMLMICFVMCRY